MKTRGLLLIIMLCCISLAQAQWTKLSTGTTNEIKGFYFLSATTAYAVTGGQNGTAEILKTVDGAYTWSTIFTVASRAIRAVHFLDGSRGVAVGSGGYVYVTANGGGSWTSTKVTNSGTLYCCQYMGGGVIYVAGDALYKSTDDGATWKSITAAYTPSYYAMHFIDASTGYLGGYNFTTGTLQKTTDGGTTWTKETNPNGNGIGAFYFFSSSSGFAVCDAGVILRTTNGGSTWTQVGPSVSSSLRSVYFVNALVGYAVGGSQDIVATNDGGTTWHDYAMPASSGPNAVWFSNSTTGFVGGQNGAIYKTSSGVGLGINDKAANQLTAVLYPNPLQNEGVLQVNSKEMLYGDILISVYDISGKLVSQNIVNASGMNNTFTINRDGLKSGLYLYTLQQKGEILLRARMAVQ
jgi:photosystem II stability/assembly factor-like uncharacterized protein